ncbi:hypothetical protein ACJJI4_09495 [Microbulbifer sp. TRSA002]|uniref:hypothetical protein n=1 Tax=Microbulbifer sp. TRSA002 TaxID=3243382 RepID=UPI0040393197
MKTIYQAIKTCERRGVEELQIDKVNKPKSTIGKICARITNIFSKLPSPRSHPPKPDSITHSPEGMEEKLMGANIHFSGKYTGVAEGEVKAPDNFVGKCEEHLKCTENLLVNDGIRAYPNVLLSTFMNFKENVIEPLIYEVEKLMECKEELGERLTSDANINIINLEGDIKSFLSKYKSNSSGKSAADSFKSNPSGESPAEIFISSIGHAKKLLATYKTIDVTLNIEEAI